jgi:outer membrane protein
LASSTEGEHLGSFGNPTPRLPVQQSEYHEKPSSKAVNLYFSIRMPSTTPTTTTLTILLPLRRTAAFLFACALGAGCETLALQDAVRLAVESNFALSLSRDKADAAVNARQGAAGNFLPSANASATRSGTFDDKPGQTSIGASANWILFDGFQNRNGYRKAQSQERSALLQERAALESLLETVVVSYYDIVQLKQRLAAIGHLLAVSQERAALAQAKLEVGAGSKLEQLQSLADLNEDSSAWLNQGISLSTAKVRLNQVLAREPSLEFDVADSIPLEAAPPLDDWRQGLAENNSAIAQARANQDASASSLAEQRGRWLPTLNTGVDYSAVPEALNSGQVGSRSGFGYNIKLSVPLFDRLATRTAVRDAKLGLRSGETRLREAELAAAADFEQARRQYTAARQRIALEERNLVVARLQAEAAQERYKLGASSPLEFRDAQTRLLDAEGRWITARQSAKQSETALQRLAGVLVKQAPEGAVRTGQTRADSAGGK